MRVYAWNVPVQVQILSPHPLTPSSCLRTECIFQRHLSHGDLRTPNSCLRTECILRVRRVIICTVRSQLMSPHGMHRYKEIIHYAAFLLPTHVSARNASAAEKQRTGGRKLPTHVSARNASRTTRTTTGGRGLPTHVSARNASGREFIYIDIPASQLMSPHGMHPAGGRQAVCHARSQLMSPHGMHPEQSNRVLHVAGLPTHVSARNASLSPCCGFSAPSLPTHVSARNASRSHTQSDAGTELPTHVSARNASASLAQAQTGKSLPTHVSARNASAKHSKK